MPGEIPTVVSRPPEPTPEHILECTPEHMTEDAPEHTSEDTTEHMSERTTERAAAAPGEPVQPSLPDHFSYSSMTAFQDCPRRWHYHYRVRAPRESVSGSLLLGAALHTALEQIHLAWLGGQRLPVAQAMAAFDAHWRRETDGQTVLFNRDENPAGLRALACELLSLYSQDCLPSQGMFLAVEERVAITLPSLSVPVAGRLDALVDSGQALVVVDAKTSKAAYTQQKLAPAAAQLSFYASGVEALARQLGKPLAGRFLVFRKIKRPRIDTVDVSLSPGEVQRTHRMLAETWALIEAAHRADSFPTRPSWMCGQCPFQERCLHDTVLGA